MNSKQGMERAIGRLSAVFVFCFLGMALGLGYWSIIRANALVERSDNPRRIEDERRIRRGDILDRHGTPLVRSDPLPMEAWQRSYLYTETAPIVGYYSINHGTGGIEDSYNAQIRGDRPLSLAEQLKNELLHIHARGISVTLTLDLPLQQIANSSLGEWNGALVLLDVHSGEILAMVSHPTFDPNTLDSDWPSLQFDPDNPLLNRAVQGLYAPGQIFETVTLAAAYQEGLATPTQVFSEELGVIISVDPPVSCPQEPPQASFTLGEAYQWPCSVTFGRLGIDLRGEKLADYAARMGIGRPFELPIPVSSGQLLERGRWSNLLAARTAMGQGELLVTPLEMAVMAATMANDGQRPVPSLVRQVGTRPVLAPQQPRPAIQPEVAQVVQQVLIQSMANGENKMPLRARSAVQHIAGRAGSAESGRTGAPDHAWFIGFAPHIEPRYAVAVIAEYGVDGWSVAAPIGMSVLEEAIK